MPLSQVVRPTDTAHDRRILRFRGAISDSSVGEVCRRTNRTSFYTFWDWYWCDPTGKILNGVCSYGKVWWVSRIIIDIVQLKPIEIYLDSSLRVPVPITNFIYKTHFIGICSVHALEQLQNTPQLIYMSLNKNSVYCVMPRSSKPPDTCKWGGNELRGILKFSPCFKLKSFSM